MTTRSLSLPNTQADEALRLLAGLYARRFAGEPPGRPLALARWHACERLRDLFLQARSHLLALASLDELMEPVEAEHASSEAEVAAWRACVGEARDLLAQVIQAGGSGSVLLAGETDGVRHLCLRCSRDARNFERVRFFHPGARRWLLKPEVSGERRSAYARCQICVQALAPVTFVVLIPAGTRKHEQGCPCLDCNQAGLAHLLNLYACDQDSHAVLLPRVAQVAAPSIAQARARAFSSCWRQGWYVLFEQPPA